jgi:hypothetical protein
MLIMTKVGEVMQNSKTATKQDIKDAEVNIDEVVHELIPALIDIQLDASLLLDLIPQIMEHIAPSDNEYLDKNGVKVDESPKVEKAG